MKTFMCLVFGCFLASCKGWNFPGYPGLDCPTTREKMQKDPDNQWMLPKCVGKSFNDMQCYDDHPDVCMCVAPDGTIGTFPETGLQSCACYTEQYRIFERDGDVDLPKCRKDGTFEPLQCSEKTGDCWCVDPEGNVIVPPSKNVHSC